MTRDKLEEMYQFSCATYVVIEATIIEYDFEIDYSKPHSYCIYINDPYDIDSINQAIMMAQEFLKEFIFDNPEMVIEVAYISMQIDANFIATICHVGGEPILPEAYLIYFSTDNQNGGLNYRQSKNVVL